MFEVKQNILIKMNKKLKKYVFFFHKIHIQFASTYIADSFLLNKL